MSITAGRRCNWVGVGSEIGLVTPGLWVGGVVSSRDAKLGSLGAAREGSLGLSRALIALLGDSSDAHTLHVLLCSFSLMMFTYLKLLLPSSSLLSDLTTRRVCGSASRPTPRTNLSTSPTFFDRLLSSFWGPLDRCFSCTYPTQKTWKLGGNRR